MTALIDLWGQWEIEATFLYWALLPVFFVLVCVGWLIGKVKANPAAATGVIGVITFVLAAAVTTLVVYNADAEESGPEAEANGRIGLGEGDAYVDNDGNLAEVDSWTAQDRWDNMGPNERSGLCGVYATDGVGLIRGALISEGYPVSHVNDTMRLLADECAGQGAVIEPNNDAPAVRTAYEETCDMWIEGKAAGTKSSLEPTNWAEWCEVVNDYVDDAFEQGALYDHAGVCDLIGSFGSEDEFIRFAVSDGWTYSEAVAMIDNGYTSCGVAYGTP